MAKPKFPKPKLFAPKNKKKYIGDANKIVCRSGLERKFMNKMDLMENIVHWSSEEIFVPYINPLDNQPHRYFPDFLIRAKQSDGSEKTFMIEIKPHAQTKKPVINKRKSKRYEENVKTWIVNAAKWEAAVKYCKKRNWTFLVITEKTLGTW